MYPQKQGYTLYDNVTPVAVTSSTDATPIVITATGHGYTSGQRVLIYGHTTNVAANGIYSVTVLTANTFSLQDEILIAKNVAGSGAGSGSGGITVPAPAVMHISDFRNMILQLGTSGNYTGTFKVAGSIGKSANSSINPRGNYPNFGGTISPANPYSFLEIMDLATTTGIAGATGIVLSGTDFNTQYEIYAEAQLYVTVIPTAWTQGAFTVKSLVVTNA